MVILPRLKPGVLVHVHDISLPRNYPKVHFDQNLYWNEQYLLQAYLAHNNRIEVIWPGNYMVLHRPTTMASLFPEIQIMRQHFPLSNEPSRFAQNPHRQSSRQRPNCAVDIVFVYNIRDIRLTTFS